MAMCCSNKYMPEYLLFSDLLFSCFPMTSCMPISDSLVIVRISERVTLLIYNWDVETGRSQTDLRKQLKAIKAMIRSVSNNHANNKQLHNTALVLIPRCSTPLTL